MNNSFLFSQTGDPRQTIRQQPPLWLDNICVDIFLAITSGWLNAAEADDNKSQVTQTGLDLPPSCFIITPMNQTGDK